MSRALIIPLTDEQYERWQDWQECAAFRIVPVDDETARLEATNDLELITRPEGAS